ncbi:DUF397 domain-containing protein [Streptomyces sp. NPDC087294]|uniref:DUF397 domain-containing protein n=1 Tax=Streptomyces sp. NPDC087294 TaxID=3365777 RepID=UPI0037F72D5F
MSNNLDPEPLRWIKSTYSAGEGQCVEWAPQHAVATGEFLVRDSKTPHGPRLTLTTTSWAQLIYVARNFDL